MPYFHCHDCHKVIHIDDDFGSSCPVCGSENGDILSDQEHHREVEEGYLFHDDTD